MTIVGSHWICGEHETPEFVPVQLERRGAAERDWLDDVVAGYPFPLAITYCRLRDDVLAHRNDGDALHQLIRLKDCVETLVKYLAIVAISARLDRRDPVDALDRQILQKLVAPSLGSWAQGILQPVVRAPTTADDVRLQSLVQYANKEFFTCLQEFTSLRNCVLGHGLVRDPREDRHDLDEWLPRLDKLLAGARFLSRWELVEAGDPPRGWMGAQAEAVFKTADVDPAHIGAIAGRSSEFLLVPDQGHPFSLFPFIYLLICPRCADAQRLFVYDSQKRFTTARQEANMVEHTAGHKCAFVDPAKAMADRFSEEMLLEYYRQHRRNFEVLEGKLTEFDFDTYRRRVQYFVGRRPVLDAIAAFTGRQPVSTPAGLAGPFDRGYFLLVAEAGIGKTALLTHWIDHSEFCGEPIRFYWRRGRNLTTLDFLRHVYHCLLAKHNIEDQDPPQGEHDYRIKLDSLLKVVSERYLSEGEREVIVVDGLDEAGSGEDRHGALAAIPRALPPNVYFLLSSRPVRELNALGGGQERCLRYTLDAASSWNRADVRQYVERQLGILLTTGEMSPDLLPRIDEAADGNFLWAEQFCLSVRRGTLPPQSVADALPRMQGLDELYREFWCRVVRTLSEEAERRLWRVIGILSVARTALTGEQICRYAGIEDDQWIVCRAQLQQYLDEVELQNERDSEDPFVGFRIYHASFRDFLLRDSGLVARQHHERILRTYCPAQEATSPRGRTDYRSWDRYGISFAPCHAIQAGCWDELEMLLTDVFFLEAKIEAGLAFELAGDFEMALAALPADRPIRQILWLLDEAIRRDIHFIARHARDYPQGLFQCLWNSGWWYDCDEAARHDADGRAPGSTIASEVSEATAESGSCSENGPLSGRAIAVDQRLCQLLERWRREKDDATPGFTWLRALRPPSIHLDSAQRRIFRGHEESVASVVFSPDGNRIVSCGDQTVRIWDLQSGAELRVLRGHQGYVRSVAFSPDANRIAAAVDDTLHVWDAHCDADPIVLGCDCYVTSVAFSPEGDRLVGGFLGGVQVWDVANGSELAVLQITTPSEVLGRTLFHKRVANCVAFSPCGDYIASGWDNEAWNEGVVRVWDPVSETLLSCFCVPGSKVNSVAFSADGNLIATGSTDEIVRVWEAKSGTELGAFSGHNGCVKSVAFSPSGDRIVSGSLDHTVRMWDARTGEQLNVWRGHDASVESVAFSPCGDRIVSGASDATVRVWDVCSNKEVADLREHESNVTSLVFSPSGERIVSGSDDRTVRMWDAHTGAELAVMDEHETHVKCVAFSPDGERIVSRSIDGAVFVRDAASGAELAAMRWHRDYLVSCVAYSPDEDRIVTGSFNGSVRLWDARTRVELGDFGKHNVEVTSLAFSPNGDRIVSASRDGTVRLWDVASRALLGVCRGHERAITDVAFSPCGDRIVSGSLDGTMRVWDAAREAELTILSWEARGLTSMACSPRGDRIAGGSLDGTVRVWDAESGNECTVMVGHESSVNSVGLSPTGDRIVSGSEDETVRVWDTDRGAELAALSGHEAAVLSVAFSPDGDRIVSGGGDFRNVLCQRDVNASVRVWDAASGAQLIVVPFHGSYVTPADNLAFSPSGDRIVVQSSGALHVWNATDGSELAVLQRDFHDGTVSSVAFSPLGDLIAGGLTDGTVQVWNADDGKKLNRIHGHTDSVRCVAFSPDGTQIASGAADKILRLWDVNSGAELAVWGGHEEELVSVAFSPSGHQIVSASQNEIRLWDAQRGQCLNVIQGSGDVRSVAAGATKFPLRALARDRQTSIVDVCTGEPIAYFPISLNHIASCPKGRTWTGSKGNHVYILTLEGEPGFVMQRSAETNLRPAN